MAPLSPRPLLLAALVPALVTASALPARADAPGQTAAATRPERPPAPAVAAKKPGTATAAAIIGTLVGPALIMTGAALSGRDSGDDALESGLYWAGAMGLMLGPSAGHWYAGRTVTAGMGLRAAGATLAVAGAVGSFDKCFFVEEPCDDSGYLAMALLGAGAFVAGVAYDVATADDAAREWNRDHGFSVQVAPTAVRTGAGGVTPGVALAGTF